MSLIDTTTDFGERVRHRLDNEQVIWLTTLGKNGTPQPSPVWFQPDGGDEVLIYSQPHTPKVRNIDASPGVALSFNSTFHGGDVVIFNGEARLDPDAPKAKDHVRYLDKYREGISSIGMTPESFSESYSAPIRVRLTRLRGF